MTPFNLSFIFLGVVQVISCIAKLMWRVAMNDGTYPPRKCTLNLRNAFCFSFPCAVVFPLYGFGLLLQVYPRVLFRHYLYHCCWLWPCTVAEPCFLKSPKSTIFVWLFCRPALQFISNIAGFLLAWIILDFVPWTNKPAIHIVHGWFRRVCWRYCRLHDWRTLFFYQ